jgi:septum formation protein
VSLAGPFQTTGRLILASASPRRRILLQDLGLAFEIIEPQVEEQPLAGETPEEFVIRAACDKVRAVSCEHVSSWVLGADTVVVHDSRILGKPEDAPQALSVLLSLAGKKHLVHTAFCLEKAKDQVSVSRIVTTEVWFSSFSRDIAAAYVATGEPLDKAGAYGIQGCGGFLVEKIHGSYSNVVGLPMAEVLRELLRYKVAAARQG